jgi:hypothetical protein
MLCRSREWGKKMTCRELIKRLLNFNLDNEVKIRYYDADDQGPFDNVVGIEDIYQTTEKVGGEIIAEGPRQ